MRSLGSLKMINMLADKKKPPVKKVERLHKEAIDILTEDKEKLERELRALKLRVLSWDKKEADWARKVRSATEDAEVLLEVVSLFAEFVPNDTRGGRKVREQARQMLEGKGVVPPTTLGSSRNRKKTKRRASETTNLLDPVEDVVDSSS